MSIVVRLASLVAVVIRDPVERAMSSYRYNYLHMIGTDGRGLNGNTKKKSHTSRRKKRTKDNVPIENEDERYNHLEAIISDSGEIISSSATSASTHVTFSEFVKAEMAFLRSCADPNTKNIMKSCLTDTSTLDAQWSNITKATPSGELKELKTHSSYLVRSMLGRGFYRNQLEGWEREHDVKVVCVEHLTRDEGGAVLTDVADFIGLADFDFTDTLKSKGVYNYGRNTGYGRSTTWDEFERKKRAGGGGIDENLRAELIEFYKEFGEWDYFASRCGWSNNNLE